MLLGWLAYFRSAVVVRHDLSDVDARGERWEGAPQPTLERVLLHLVQEYARPGTSTSSGRC